MKHLWMAVVLLAVVFGCVFYHLHYLQAFTGQLTAVLEGAQWQAEQEDWDGVQSSCAAAKALWDSENAYLHIMLRHADTDTILLYFDDLLLYSQLKHLPEYTLVNTKLVNLLGLLYEMERPILSNIL